MSDMDIVEIEGKKYMKVRPKKCAECAFSLIPFLSVPRSKEYRERDRLCATNGCKDWHFEEMVIESYNKEARK